MLFKRLIEKAVEENKGYDYKNYLKAFIYAVLAFVVAYYFKQNINDDHHLDGIWIS